MAHQTTEFIIKNGCKGCRYLIELFKHPWNKQFKGACSESTGLYACLIEHEIDNNNNAMIFDTITVGCEMYDSKEPTNK